MGDAVIDLLDGGMAGAVDDQVEIFSALDPFSAPFSAHVFAQIGAPDAGCVPEFCFGEAFSDIGKEVALVGLLEKEFEI